MKLCSRDDPETGEDLVALDHLAHQAHLERTDKTAVPDKREPR